MPKQINLNHARKIDGGRSAAQLIQILLLFIMASVTPVFGDTPSVSLSRTSIAFPTQAVGSTSAVESVTLTNTSGSTLNIAGITLGGANTPNFLARYDCGGSLAPGASCTISVTFAAAYGGRRSAFVAITDDAPDSPQTVQLYGRSTYISFSPSSLVFPSQAVGATSAVKSVILTNGTSSTLNIASIALGGANTPNFLLRNNCGSALAAGASCSIDVTFAAASSGSRSAFVAVTDDAHGSPQMVSLSGTTTDDGASASLTPSSLSFAGLGISISSPVQIVTLTNTGSVPLNVAGVTIVGANSGDFTENSTCGSTLAAGANCTIVVLFSPLALGTRTATLSISDSASASPQTVSLQGGGSHNVVLTWSASPSAGVIGYNIYRGTTSAGEGSTALNSTPVDATTYSDETVTPGTNYYYVLTSVTSDAGESGKSEETSAAVPSP